MTELSDKQLIIKVLEKLEYSNETIDKTALSKMKDELSEITSTENVSEMHHRISAKPAMGPINNSTCRAGTINNAIQKEETFKQIMVCWITGHKPDELITDTVFVKKRRKRYREENDCVSDESIVDKTDENTDENDFLEKPPLKVRIMNNLCKSTRVEHTDQNTNPNFPDMLEKATEKFLRKIYSDDSICTRGSLYNGDGGIDVFKENVLAAQCKYHNKPIGKGAIIKFAEDTQEYKNIELHFSAAEYTENAILEAEKLNINLYLAKIRCIDNKLCMYISPLNY